jgi:peptide/nickel transport system permease protein
VAEVAAPASAVIERKSRNFLVGLLIRLVKEKPLGLVGGLIILTMFLVGIFCNQLAPYGFAENDLFSRLAPPSTAHILGCDHLGRDVFSRIIYGARISMLVSVIASAISVAGSTIIGITSGYLGGKFDLFMQRWVDAVQAFPNIVLYLTVMSIIGPGLWQVILLLGISGAIGGGRVIRSAVITLKENMFVDAARVVGASQFRILLRHITPHVIPLIIISFSLSMGGMILAEASLSFLGFGIPPPYPSWGGMISGAGRTYMEMAPWMMLYPGLALFLVVYGINMLGDAVRDLLDPRLRGGIGRYGGMGQKSLQKLIEKKIQDDAPEVKEAVS